MIEINGATLAVVFRCSSNEGNSEGLLMGWAEERRMENQKDDKEDQNSVSVEKVAHITSIQTSAGDGFCSFYNPVGEIDVDSLENKLKDTEKQPLGWFRYRRYTTLRPSARDIAVTSQLSSYLRHRVNDDSVYLPAIFLLISECVDNGILTFNYSFFSINPYNVAHPVPYKILNLITTSTQDYDLKFSSSFRYSRLDNKRRHDSKHRIDANSVMKDIATSFGGESGIHPLIDQLALQSNEMERLNKLTLQEMEEMAKKVEDSSNQIRLLEEKLFDLRSRKNVKN